MNAVQPEHVGWPSDEQCHGLPLPTQETNGGCTSAEEGGGGQRRVDDGGVGGLTQRRFRAAGSLRVADADERGSCCVRRMYLHASLGLGPLCHQPDIRFLRQPPHVTPVHDNIHIKRITIVFQRSSESRNDVKAEKS